MPNGSHLGNVIQVAVNGNVIGCCTSLNIARTRAEIELKCKGSSDYSDFKGGTAGTEINIGGFVQYDATQGFEQFVDAWQSNTDLANVSVEPPDTGEPIWTWPTMAVLDVTEDANVDEGHSYTVRLKAREAATKTDQT